MAVAQYGTTLEMRPPMRLGRKLNRQSLWRQDLFDRFLTKSFVHIGLRVWRQIYNHYMLNNPTSAVAPVILDELKNE
jgi:hypothetical protein